MSKELAQSMIDEYRISIKRACLLVLLHRSMWYYQSQARDEGHPQAHARDSHDQGSVWLEQDSCVTS
jgi:hypothetical protein